MCSFYFFSFVLITSIYNESLKVFLGSVTGGLFLGAAVCATLKTIQNEASKNRILIEILKSVQKPIYRFSSERISDPTEVCEMILAFQKDNTFLSFNYSSSV